MSEELICRCCPECGSKAVKTNIEDHTFPYGIGVDAVELSCKLPVRKCVRCGFEYYDHEGNDIMTAAIQKHTTTKLAKSQKR